MHPLTGKTNVQGKMGIHQPSIIKFSNHANLMHVEHQTGWQGFGKRLLDKTAALAGLVILSPVLLGASIAIKLDSDGPVIFRQPRHGKDNEIFHIWKFRTMTVMETGNDFVQAKNNDTRVTRIGNFLRRTSIDELPQLVNVLKGEMSLVGPRPHPVALNYEFALSINEYWNRHCVMPGLTGLAQVRGFRGPTDTLRKMQNRVDSDIEYVLNWSLLEDLKILVMTPWLVVTGKNAL